MLAPYSFVNFLHSDISVHQCCLRVGPVIFYLLFVWRKLDKLIGCSSGWGPPSPIFNNDRLLIGGHPVRFPNWERKNIFVHLMISLGKRVTYFSEHLY